MAADQLLMAPAGLALFLVTMRTLEGAPSEAPAFLQDKWPSLLQVHAVGLLCMVLHTCKGVT